MGREDESGRMLVDDAVERLHKSGGIDERKTRDIALIDILAVIRINAGSPDQLEVRGEAQRPVDLKADLGAARKHEHIFFGRRNQSLYRPPRRRWRGRTGKLRGSPLSSYS